MFNVSKKIFAISIFGFLLSISTQMLYSHLPLYLKYEIKASELQIAALDGFVEFISYFVRIFSGILCDSFNNRKSLILYGTIIACFIKPVFAISKSFSIIAIAEFIERIGNGIQACPRDALIANCSHTKFLASSFGIFKSMKTAGTIIGTIFAFSIMYFFDYNTLFFLAFIPAFLALLVLLFIKDNKKSENIKKFQYKSLKNFDSKFWKLIGLCGLCELSHFGESLFSIYASSITTMQIAGMTAMFTGCGQALFSYPVGLFADKFGKYFILKICLFGIFISYFGLFFFSGITMFFFFIFVLCGQQACIQNIFLSIITEQIPKKLHGTAIGIFYFTIGATYFIASNICGNLWHYYGKNSPFIYGTIVSAISLFVLLKKCK